jgi:hypothetical protein
MIREGIVSNALAQVRRSVQESIEKNIGRLIVYFN